MTIAVFPKINLCLILLLNIIDSSLTIHSFFGILKEIGELFAESEALPQTLEPVG